MERMGGVGPDGTISELPEERLEDCRMQRGDDRCGHEVEYGHHNLHKIHKTVI